MCQISAEAEYFVLAYALREALLLRKFEPVFDLCKSTHMIIIEYNDRSIKLAQNGVVNDKSKLIDLKYEMIIYNAMNDDIVSHYTKISEILADIRTKYLGRKLSAHLIGKLGMKYRN